MRPPERQTAISHLASLPAHALMGLAKEFVTDKKFRLLGRSNQEKASNLYDKVAEISSKNPVRPPLLRLLHRAEQIRHSGIPASNPVITSEARVKMESNRIPRRSRKTKVFIVHGTNHDIRNQVEQLISRLRLEPVILEQKASGGRTIIEKFSDESQDADFAIVIYTPDDIGGHRSPDGAATKETLAPRARQNVIFEHGYFYAHLGRKNVAALVVDNEIERHSDIHGVIYVSANNPNWKHTLAGEMIKAGIRINASDMASI